MATLSVERMVTNNERITQRDLIMQEQKKEFKIPRRGT